MLTTNLSHDNSIQPLTRKVILSIALLFIGTTLAISLKFYNTIKQQAEHNLSTLADTLSWESRIALTNGNPTFTEDILAQLKNSPTILSATLYDTQSNIVADYNPGLLSNKARPILPNNLQKADDPELSITQSFLNIPEMWWQKIFGDIKKYRLATGYSEIIEYSDGGYIHLFRPVLWNNNPVGILHVTSEFDRSNTFIGYCYPIFAGLLIFTGLVYFLIQHYIEKRLAKPIVDLTTMLTLAINREPYNLTTLPTNFEPMIHLTYACKQIVEQLPTTDKKLNPQSITPIVDNTHQLAELTYQYQKLLNINYATVAAKTDAETANHAKLDFLASISHEIRTPMSAVLGMADFLWETDLKPEQRNCLEVMRQSSALLLKIANDILDFAKIETGELALSKNEFNCNELLRSNFQLLELEAKSKGLKYALETSIELPNLLTGDSARLTQILVNLLSNAIKYTAQGEVRLRASCQPRAYRKIRLFCEITDTGIGIAPEQLDLIFKAFSQSQSTLTRIYPGTGLGLAITKQLVQLMAGQIGVNSQPGIGSTFWFWVDLPISNTPIKPVKPQNNYRFKAKLLVAEDYPANQLVVERFLEDLGCQVHLVNNGFEAVKALKNQHFDLVFMDCQMPFLNGYEATREIRSMETERSGDNHMPIIALTAHALNEDEIKCKDAGMDEWVTKPFTRHDLSKILQKWLPQELILTNQPTLKTDVQTLAKASNVLDDNSAINMRFFSQQFKLDNIDDLAFLSALTKTFQQNAASILSNMQHSIDDANIENIRKLAHGLKSLSSNVGSGKLTELCSAMEQTGNTAQIRQTQEILDSMKQEYLRVLGELNALCTKA